MQRSRRRMLAAAACAGVPLLNSCGWPLSMNLASTAPRVRVDDLFRKTKLMCIGRYAVEVPDETQQDFGFQEIGAGFKHFRRADFDDPSSLLRAQWKEVLFENRTAEMASEIAEGPVAGARYVWFYWSDYAKRHDSRLLYGVMPAGDTLYLYRAMTNRREGRPPEELFRRMTALMRGMRPWNGTEVPRQAGVCIHGAFIHEPTHRFQEIMSSGFYFPSLPDVRFSVMSNKNASVEGDNGKGLLERVDEARREQIFYPYITLRRGKRTLHGLWDGEEMLARRSDGALLFDWEMVGQPRNVARPPWFVVGLRTRVADDKVGAAKSSSLSDAQALRLWDRLLEGLKFRVAVPGCTPQSVALV